MPKIFILGLGEVIRGFEFFEVAALENVLKQIEESADRVQASAETAAPEDTGLLKGHIKKIVNKNLMTGKITYMKRGGRHGRFIEFGTKHIPAKPFLGPAWEREKDNFQNGIINAINKSIPGQAAQ